MKRKWRSIKDAGLYDPNARKKSAKVRITTFIDSNILAELKAEARRTKVGYQTILNDLLKKVVFK